MQDTPKADFQSHPEEKPNLSTYDSSYECSLDHWLEVYWLVEEEYLFAKDADSEFSN